MIDFSAKHIGYVAASYGLTCLVLGALIIWVIARSRRISRRLAQLDAQRTSRQPQSDKVSS